jgi:hypothetical protein
MALLSGNVKDLEIYTSFYETKGQSITEQKYFISTYNCVDYNHNRCMEFKRQNAIELTKALDYRVCASCNRSLPASQVKQITKISDNIINQTIFTEILGDSTDKIEAMICTTYCLADLKTNKIPKYSEHNNMKLDKTPNAIKELNFYEKLLIHQAKCFQTIVQMKPLSNQTTNYKCAALKGNYLVIRP